MTPFIKAAAERAIKTFAQSILALLGTGSVGITTLDWKGILSVAATAALASVLTSLASLSTVAPSIVPEAKAEAPAAAWEGDGHGVNHDNPALGTAPAAVFPAAKVEAAIAPVEPVAVTPVFEAPAEAAAPVA